ncbi:MAG: radical SAM protein [Spirochaetales bacterium]|nr:radical SAM protein [Spirochaetales bacterium]
MNKIDKSRQNGKGHSEGLAVPGLSEAEKPKVHIFSKVNKVKQVLNSVPHYFSELSEVRSPGEFYNWIYFKFPNLLPLIQFPPHVCVEFTNSCNLSCQHCWRMAMNRPEGFLELSLFDKIIKELSLHKYTILKIAGAGEPSIHPRLSELMEMLSPYHNKVYYYTNGSLFRKVSFDEILSWRLYRIIVSVDGIDAESYERIKAGSHYHTLEKDIKAFYEYRESLGRKYPAIEIRHIVMPPETNKELRDFRKKWIETADKVNFNPLEPSSGFSEVEDPNPPKCRSISRERCIHWDGNVPVCGGPRSNVYSGNVLNSSIAELWKHPQVEFVRQSNRRRDFDKVPQCKRCLHCR